METQYTLGRGRALTQLMARLLYGSASVVAGWREGGANADGRGMLRDRREVDRLFEEVQRTQAERRLPVRIVWVRGEHEHHGVGREHTGEGHDLQPAVALAAQSEVGHDEIEALRTQALEGFGKQFRGADEIALNLEELDEDIADGLLIFNDEDRLDGVRRISHACLQRQKRAVNTGVGSTHLQAIA